MNTRSSSTNTTRQCANIRRPAGQDSLEPHQTLWLMYKYVIFSFWAGEPVRSLYSAQNEALNVLVKLSKSCIVSWDTIMCIMYINLPCIELCSLYKSWHGLQCAPCHCKTFLSLAQWVLSRIVLGGGCITPPLWNLLYLEAQLQIVFLGAGQSLVFRKYRCGGALGFVSS